MINDLELKFDEETHTYTLGDKELISVTTLLSKHGLAPDYTLVDSEVLAKKAEYGKLVHKEIEEYCKHEILGFSDELYAFIKYTSKYKVKVLENELQVHNDQVAGTIDLVLKVDDILTIADIKTTYAFHRNTVQWQLSLYAYLYANGDEEVYNTIKLQAYHFNKASELKVVPLEAVPFNTVKFLLDCEAKGEIYTTHVVTDNDERKMVELADLQIYMMQLDAEVKRLKEIQDKIKADLIVAMEERGVSKFENDLMKVTYKPAYIQRRFDSNRFKGDYKEIYNEYLKEVSYGANVVIEFKKLT